MTIALLLATYNGERYLDRQIESIVAQSETDWRLYIRDDGSTDGTTDVIARWVQRDHRIVPVVSDTRDAAGANRAFAALLRAIGSEIPAVMFCDQDDTWHPDKIERCIRAMHESERVLGDVPILVHTDLVVVDQVGAVIHPSFWEHSGLDPRLNAFHRLVLVNTITGCTTLLNRPLAKLVRDMPDQALMHDWWSGLVAAAFGHIVVLHHSSVDYRQHETNVFGARARRTGLSGTVAAFGGLLREGWARKRRKILELPLRQAVAFREHFSGRLPDHVEHILDGLARFEHLSWIQRRALLLRHRCLRQTALQNAALMLLA